MHLIPPKNKFPAVHPPLAPNPLKEPHPHRDYRNQIQETNKSRQGTADINQ